jgi:hypothetical protein
MIDLLTIQTIGVIAAAFTLALNALNTIRVSNEEGKKRKIEFTNNIMRTLYTEEGWRRYMDIMSVEWTDFEDYKKKYDSTVNREHWAKRHSILSTLDTIGYLYRRGLMDEDTVYQIGGGSIALWVYAKYIPIMREYRKVSWGADTFINVDYLGKKMYEIKMKRDPSFALDPDYFKEEDLKHLDK